jgi:excisionase family DNA binding protein
MPRTDEYLTTGDAARVLRVDPATVRMYERAGRLPALRTPGGLRLFARSDVERLAHEREARLPR